MTRLRCLVMVGLIAIIALSATTTAQTTGQPEPGYIIIQDSLKFPLRQEGRTVSADDVAPSYAYKMDYGPVSNTFFTFTECRKNGQLLKLLAWNYNRIVHAPAELMSFNSRTANFLIHAGDTLSFYRDMEWYESATGHQDTNNYYALDTLEMITYLVRAADGSPLVQLDSLGVLPRTTPGMPTIYGTRPIMATVSYTVPPSLDGDSVLIGITVRAQGSGQYHFLRRDGITIGRSKRLISPMWQELLAAMGTVHAKRSIDELMRASGEEGTVLAVSTVPSSPRDLRITFNGPRKGGATTIAIYDESGVPVFYPYNSRTDVTQSETIYRAPKSGAYFVVLMHNGRIVKTQKIIIAQ